MVDYDGTFKARILQEMLGEPDADLIAQDELNRFVERTADPVADAEKCIKLWDDDGSQMAPV